MNSGYLSLRVAAEWSSDVLDASLLFCARGRTGTGQLCEGEWSSEASVTFWHFGVDSVETNVRPGAGICLYVLECKSRLRESLRERVREEREIWDKAKLLVPTNRRKHFNQYLILSPSRKKLASPLFWINTFEMSFILAALDKLTYFLSLVAFCVCLSYSWLIWEIIHLIWSGFGTFEGHFQLIASGLWQLFNLDASLISLSFEWFGSWPLRVCFFSFPEMRITDLKCLFIYLSKDWATTERMKDFRRCAWK